MRTLEKAGFALAGVGVVALELLALATWQGWLPTRATARIDQAIAAVTAEPEAALVASAAGIATTALVAASTQSLTAAAVLPAPALAAASLRPEDHYYAQLRSKIRWVPTRMGRETLPTPDLQSRMLLAKAAAKRAGLQDVGLGFADVYGIINAETSWVPRTGASKDGTPNLGVAQFEPETARLLGLRNPHDVVEAVHVAAVHMKEAAEWSGNRIARLRLGQEQRAEKLREGVSIYYNLSSKGRSAWNGNNTARLPKETQFHIRNARIGAQQAAVLDTQLQASPPARATGGSVLLAGDLPRGG